MLKTLLKKFVSDTAEQLAVVAVRKAEQALGSGKGEEKKVMAVNYVMARLRLPAFLEFLRPCIEKTLLAIIDEIVELAVEKLNQLRYNKIGL